MLCVFTGEKIAEFNWKERTTKVELRNGERENKEPNFFRGILKTR